MEGANWSIADGAEELIGHEIPEVYQFGDTSNKLTSNNDLGYYTGVVDKYGFAVNMPAVYFNQSEKKSVEYSQEYAAGTTFEPTIKYEDALGLAGMNAQDRGTFLTRVQNVLDQIAPDLKANQLKYSIGGYGTSSEPIVRVEGAGYEPGVIRDEINQALKKDKTLLEMLSKANASQNKHLDELTISVTDRSGNPLAKNEVIISANGRSMKTTVDTIKNLDYIGVLDMLGKN